MVDFTISVGCVTFHSLMSLTESPPPLGSGSYRLILVIIILVTLHFFLFKKNCEKSFSLIQFKN